MDATVRLDWMIRDARDPLYRAANRLSIRIYGCAIDSLSRRELGVITRLYRFAAEDQQRWLNNSGRPAD